MQVVEKEMSHKRKVMSMYKGQFYLRPDVKRELLSMIERSMIVSNRAAVNFIDQNGEWLTHEKE